MGWYVTVCGGRAATEPSASATRYASDPMTGSGQESPGLESQAKVSGGPKTSQRHQHRRAMEVPWADSGWRGPSRKPGLRVLVSGITDRGKSEPCSCP